MRMHPIYVSFFTTGSGYEQEARELVKTLDAFALPCDVIGIPGAVGQGAWHDNTRLKPAFLRTMLAKHAGRPVVWLDADARVRRYPELFERLGDEGGQGGCDFAAHWREDPNYPHGELLSGTLYFSGSQRSIDLVHGWIRDCHANPTHWDQVCLDRAVTEATSCAGLRIAKLPAPYTLIFDTMAHLGPPVIEHLQASRRLRR